MTDDDRVRALLRAAAQPVTDARPTRDLWPLVVNRVEGGATWSWLDFGLAAAVTIALLMFPNLLLLLAYHL
jgi:ABC-type phosphate transport system auxiliary subunit